MYFIWFSGTQLVSVGFLVHLFKRTNLLEEHLRCVEQRPRTDWQVCGMRCKR